MVLSTATRMVCLVAPACSETATATYKVRPPAVLPHIALSLLPSSSSLDVHTHSISASRGVSQLHSPQPQDSGPSHYLNACSDESCTVLVDMTPTACYVSVAGLLGSSRGAPFDGLSTTSCWSSAVLGCCLCLWYLGLSLCLGSLNACQRLFGF